LKKNSDSDKVAVVDCHTCLIAPLFAKLVNAVSLRHFMLAIPFRKTPVSHRTVLSPDDVRVLEEIIVGCDSHGMGRSRNVHEIIEIALLRLQKDLDSGFKEEIIEDLQREIDYRLWCTRCG
jgi:hypothetical protein